MKKKILTLALLAPFIYTACNSTVAKPEPKIKKESIAKKEVTLEKKVSKSTTSKPSDTKGKKVSYVGDKPLIEEEGLLHIEGFMGTLKPTLMSLMKLDKTHQMALGGCSSMAMGMTDDYNKAVADNGGTSLIRRTALKYRNPKNLPDSTDTLVMENFVASKNLMKPLVVDMKDHYRVYKALPMKQECMACHGDIEQMSPKLVKMIDKMYPKDLATGLKLGEFRGAMVAEIKK